MRAGGPSPGTNARTVISNFGRLLSAAPLRTGRLFVSVQPINTLSVATRQPDGFPEEAFEQFRRLTGLLTMILERVVALENTDTALRTYLGRHASCQVIRGKIRAGHGQSARRP